MWVRAGMHGVNVYVCVCVGGWLGVSVCLCLYVHLWVGGFVLVCEWVCIEGEQKSLLKM